GVELIGECVDVDVSGKYGNGRPAHAQRIVVPAYSKLAAPGIHQHRAVEQPAPDTRHDRRAGACAASKGLAGATLVHAQLDGVAVDDLHEARIDALLEPRMRFYKGACFSHRGVIDVGDHLN